MSIRHKQRYQRPPTVERKCASQVVKLIVTGSAASGKSQFIDTISQYTEQRPGPGGKWLFGRVRVDQRLILHFLEPPTSRQFDFFWLRDTLTRVQATGFVVMVDSTRPQYFGEFLSIVYTIRGYHDDPPLVIAANKQDARTAWTPQDIQLGLGIRDLRVLPCVASNHHHVREIVVDLLYQVLA